MKDNNVFDIVLLQALPASGKSEVRNFLANIEPQRLIEEFHIGDNVQLDDFPYVNFMRLIDRELIKMNEKDIFYPGENPFYDPRDWATLINLLNEDYKDLLNCNKVVTESYAAYLFDRIDRAAKAAGIDYRLSKLDEEIKSKLYASLEEEAKKIQMDKEVQYRDTYKGKTFVFECARGGKDGSSLPLSDPFGYQYSLRYFLPEILDKAAILYIWVTPEESRRKNRARANPDDPGSNLFHGVPESVMYGDYGIDDMLYLKDISDKENTIKVNGHYLPIGVFDNRVDKTSFLRQDIELWTKEEVEDMSQCVKQATDAMWSNYR